MIWLRRIRYALWGMVAVAAFLTAAIVLGWWSVDGPAARNPSNTAPAAFGGPFTMTDHRGLTVTEQDIRAKPTMISFGFTWCPDICPTTLNEMSAWLDGLGAAADGVNAVFVSVDPERDETEQLAAYLTSFDSRITGLTGTPTQLRQMAQSYRFYYRRVPLEGGGYTMDHTAVVYLLDRDGRFAGTIDIHEDRGTALSKLRMLLGVKGTSDRRE